MLRALEFQFLNTRPNFLFHYSKQQFDQQLGEYSHYERQCQASTPKASILCRFCDTLFSLDFKCVICPTKETLPLK